ncbi:transforming protein RhoA-like [Oppia nitens]|uniref:transforming protein RhoA-like n=1 Tax=Oppia nitens TaxID=1686743 RepID=UPI0023DCE10F|nr:transforming protein RhoA-like [Oppia nitens]
MAFTKKLVVVGDGGCGKTSLLIAYCKNLFTELYTPTVFDNYVANIDIDGKVGCLALWDTAGQEDYERIRPLSYPDTDVVVICFSIDSRISFANIKLKWEPEINTYLPGIPVVLVGNKSDLQSEKTVTADDGWKMADTIGAVGYIECSAKNRLGVHKVFDVAVRAANQRRHRRRRGGGGSGQSSICCTVL